jgi:hypothetical protein
MTGLCTLAGRRVVALVRLPSGDVWTLAGSLVGGRGPVDWFAVLVASNGRQALHFQAGGSARMVPRRVRLRFLVDVDRLNESLNVHGGTVDVLEFGSLESGQLGVK